MIHQKDASPPARTALSGEPTVWRGGQVGKTILQYEIVEQPRQKNSGQVGESGRCLL